jgi:hypothetical protein
VSRELSGFAERLAAAINRRRQLDEIADCGF